MKDKPKPSQDEPPVHLRPNRPGIDSLDESRTDAAAESIAMMRTVEHPGEFQPVPPKGRKPAADRRG